MIYIDSLLTFYYNLLLYKQYVIAYIVVYIYSFIQTACTMFIVYIIKRIYS